MYVALSYIHCGLKLLVTLIEMDAHQFTQPPIEVIRKGAKATVDYCRCLLSLS